MGRGPQPTVSDEELYQLVADCESRLQRPFTTAQEIAEQANMTRQNAHRRLERLHEEGTIRKHKPGPAAVWWAAGDSGD